jgi:Fe-S-cluster containining protein
VSATLPATGRLAHLGRLAVHRSVFTRRFAAGCATARCEAACCVLGVLVDARERDQVLAHADLVRGLMTPGQELDPTRWFARAERHDRDFPSGRATHTRAGAGGCVFLDAERRCVLQKASPAAGLDLKPFFCTLFPVTIAEGVLRVDDMGTGRPAQCCGATPGGPLTIFDVYAPELEHALGPDGAADLRRLVEAAEIR